MADLIELKEEEERVILVGVSTCEEDDTERSLDELAELVRTANGVAVGRMIQNRERIHPGTYLGKGKLEELRDQIDSRYFCRPCDEQRGQDSGGAGAA